MYGGFAGLARPWNENKTWKMTTAVNTNQVDRVTRMTAWSAIFSFLEFPKLNESNDYNVTFIVKKETLASYICSRDTIRKFLFGEYLSMPNS